MAAREASDSEATDTRALIDERYEAVEAGDYLAVLCVERHAAQAQVQKAYFDLAKRIHPDKLDDPSLKDLQSKALTLFQFATEAKDVLSDRVKRNEYLRGDLKAQPVRGSDRGGPQETAEKGKIAFHKGSVMLNKRGYDDAERYLREAVIATPDNSKYWQALGWAVFQNVKARKEADRLEEAKDCWDKALELNEQSAQSHFYIALYYKAKDDKLHCRDALERALFIDPSHVDAKREMRLLRMRSEKRKKQSTGIISRIVDGLTKKR